MKKILLALCFSLSTLHLQAMEMHKKNPSAPQEIMKDQHDQTDTLAIPLDSSEEEEEEEMEMLKREQRQLQNRAHESQNTHLNNAPHNP